MEPVLFYGASHPTGHYSNFAKYNICIDNMIFFFCNEQYIMRPKASLFSDKPIADAILAIKGMQTYTRLQMHVVMQR